jgi:phage-related minor tail protein
VPNVGYATIQIIPSVRGISAELQRQLSGPAGDAGSRAGDESGGRFTEKWKERLAVAGAAAGAVLVAATVSAIEKEKLADKLAAQLGLSGKGAKQAGSVAGSLYSKAVVDSFEEGADAVRAVMGSGLIPEKATTQAIEAITTKVSDLATTFDQDLGGAANAATQLIRTGLAKDAPAALDLITKGLQSNADKAGDFLDTLNEYGVQFKKAGLDGASAVGLLNQAIAAGARDSDLAADAIKEFSIRAIDGSASSAAGFEALGLSAQDMGSQFAQGGSAANGVLTLTLSRLRDMKDPLQQSAAATALFGTQAEDLGSALFAMDPSTAAAGLGRLDGAAKAVGDTIRSNTSSQLAILGRQLMSGLGTVVDQLVLPALFGLVKVLREAAGVVGPLIDWFREWGAWLAPVVVLVGGLTLALNAQAIATAAVTAVFSVYRAAILIGTAATSGFAGAQALLNAVMALNPITLIVIALVALGAALVVAYNKSETFRAIVQAAWAGIQTAAMWAWENVLKPLFAGFMTGLRAIGEAAAWLWGVLQPVFSFIGAAARILATIILTILITPIYLAVKLLGAIFGWLWDVAIKPIWDLIAAGAMWLWNNGIKPAFENIMVQVRNVAAVFSWFWDAAVKPVFGWISGLIAETWGRIKLVWDILVAYVKLVLVPLFMNFWNGTIKPVWEGIKSAINAAWESGIKPAFELLKRGVDNVKDSFHNGITAIGLIWDKLKDITRKPVQFVIDTVYNNGIRKVWNTIADFTGAGKLGVVTFADGGRTSGGTPGRDSIPALMMADEYVIRRDSARKLGFGTLDYMNRYGSLPGFAAGGPVQRYKDGGVVGWIKGAAGSVGDFFGDMTDLITNPGKAWQAATGFIREKIASISGSGMGRLIASIPTKILSSLKDKVVSLIGSFGGGADIGGAGVQRWAPVVLQALQMVGQPASMLGTTLRRMNQESGGNPFAINNWDSNAQAGDPSRGLMQTIGSTFNAYAGPLRSRGIYDPLANIYASMRYALATYGSLPRAYDRAGGYDSGGWLQPGVTAAINETGRPEAILTGPQWQAVSSLAANRGGLAAGDRLTLVVGDREFDAYVDSRADGRVAVGKRQLMETIQPGRKG